MLDISSPLAPLTIQYADFATCQRRALGDDIRTRQLAYWKEQLSGAPAVLQLPTERSHLAEQSFEGAQQILVLSNELTTALQTLSKQEDVPLFLCLQAVFALLLQRYSGEDDLLIGMTIANRVQKEVEGLLGCFASIVPLRINDCADGPGHCSVAVAQCDPQPYHTCPWFLFTRSISHIGLICTPR